MRFLPLLLLMTSSCWGGVSDEEYSVFTALVTAAPFRCVAESTEASAEAVHALEHGQFESDGIGADALRDFIARNSISVRIRGSRIGAGNLTVIVGDASADDDRECKEVVIFSRVGFNHDHDRAVVSVAGRMQKSGFLMLFAKRSAGWKSVRTIAVPRS